MTDNLSIWNAVKQPPSYALKAIQAGRLKGKTDINPQWRYQMMTEHFGICGIGWKYVIKRVWNETESSGEIFAFAEVDLYVRHDGQWGEPIPGIGGSMLISKESSGLHASDEGYKMAITDALSVCMKMLGLASDIYAGLWDGTKYSDKTQPSSKSLTKPNDSKTTTKTDNKEHWCDEHNTAFFKKGRMKSYAHPIGDTGQWCHEHTDKSKSEPQPEQVADAPEQAETTEQSEQTEQSEPQESGIFIDMDWLRESLKTLKWTTAIISYIKTKYNVTGSKLDELVSQLSKEQQDELYREIESRLSMK